MPFTIGRREQNSLVLTVGVLAVVSIGGLVEIAPLFYLDETIEEVEGVRPYSPLALMGRDIYIREGCYNCHSQMVPLFSLSDDDDNRHKRHEYQIDVFQRFLTDINALSLQKRGSAESIEILKKIKGFPLVFCPIWPKIFAGPFFLVSLFVDS